MRSLFLIVAFAAALFTCITPAQAANADDTLGAEIGYAKAMLTLSAITYRSELRLADWTAAQATAAQAVRDLDEQVSPLVSKSAGRPAVANALKAYYVAAKSYFRDSWPSSDVPAAVARANELRLEQAMKQAADALDVELKAVDGE